MININNKVKQFFSGGWGEKIPYNIPKDFGIEDKVKCIPKRKKKSKPYINQYSVCPFCKHELKVVERKKSFWSWMPKYAEECEHCSAKKIKEGCPCCHRDTWFLSFIYTHQKGTIFDCGFTGERKINYEKD